VRCLSGQRSRDDSLEVQVRPDPEDEELKKRLRTLDQIFSALGRKSAVPQERATSTRPRKGNMPRDGRLKAPSAKPPTMPKKMPARVLKDEAQKDLQSRSSSRGPTSGAGGSDANTDACSFEDGERRSDYAEEEEEDYDEESFDDEEEDD